MSDEKINQELVISILDKLNDTINEITADVTGQNTKLITSILEQKKKEGYFDSLSLGTNSVKTINLTDESITSNKIKADYDNLITEITSNKTIDTTTGTLIENKNCFVSNFIQIRDGNGNLINDKLFINKWTDNLLWVGYGNNKTSVVANATGGSNTTAFKKTITATSNKNIYYIRVVGYYSKCNEEELKVTATEYKSLDWLRLTQENFTNNINMENIKNTTARFRETNVINININTDLQTIEYVANATGTIYINNRNIVVAKKDDNQSLSLTNNTTYVLIYNVISQKMELTKYDTSLNSCVILAYIYYYNSSLVRLALCGNDNSISVYKDRIQIFDIVVGSIGMDNIQNNITRIRESSVFDINIINETMTVTAKRSGRAYINYNNTLICSGGEEFKIASLTKNTTYVLIYSTENNTIKIIKYNDIKEKCVILAYIYYYNSSLVRLALCGNDNSISVYKDGIQIFDMQTEQSIFNHSANSKASIWSEWTTTKIDKSTTPVPFSFNSSIYANGGMFVGRAGDCNVWNTYDNGKGGHAMQLFSKDKSYRFSVVLDDRMISTGDNLPVTALHTWLTDGGKEYAFGWLHLGADMCGYVDGVDTGEETGIYVNPSMSIVNTPLLMKPQVLVSVMPKGYKVDENGSYLYDSDGKRIPQDLVGIDGKNILQVNETNDLYFHCASDNNWYKINQNTEIEAINENITTLTSKINTLETTNENLTNEVNTLKSTVESLQTELQELKTKVGNPTENHKSNNITYDNSTSGLTATDVYSAINELKTMIDNLSTTP